LTLQTCWHMTSLLLNHWATILRSLISCIGLFILWFFIFLSFFPTPTVAFFLPFFPIFFTFYFLFIIIFLSWAVAWSSALAHVSFVLEDRGSNPGAGEEQTTFFQISIFCSTFTRSLVWILHGLSCNLWDGLINSSGQYQKGSVCSSGFES
jgi:hypothetical protein